MLPVLSIRFKIFALILVAFSALIAAILWQISRQAERISDEAIERSLNQSNIILNTKIDSRFDAIREVASGIAQDGRVLPLVFDKDSLTLQDLSLEFTSVLDFDVLFFTANDGTILARSDRPQAVGSNLAGRSPLFDRALSGESSRGIIVSQGKLLQMVVEPIFDNVATDLVRGSVALAYPLSAEIAAEINALTVSDVGFFIFTRDEQRNINGVQSTFNTRESLGELLNSYLNAEPHAWQQLVDMESNFFRKEILLDGDRIVSTIQRFNSQDGKPLGFVTVSRSRTELIEPFIEIERRVLMIGGVCLFVASLVAWLFALRISRPIIELVSVTRGIQEGRYPVEQRKGRDEVGVLYDALVRMGRTLKEKAELEHYLAMMSEEVQLKDRLELNDVGEIIASPGHDDVTVLNDDSSADAVVRQRQLANQSGLSAATPARTAKTLIIDKRYQIQAKIGAGAVGTVYLAQDLDLDEKIAIKVMKKALFSQLASINFKEEIRLARQITHRNILRIFDYGSFKNVYYITMEYVSGYDLDVLLRTKGALKGHIAIIMARQICSAMNAAHEQGIIHRDLKPSNMIINRQGILKITDFGLAMKVSPGQSEANRAEHTPANSKTTIAGTPRYMAPEQFFNWTLDARTDIYAIGAIFYTIFAGEPPFSHQQFEQLAKMHLEQPVPLEPLVLVGVPENMQAIICKCMAKQPDDRYQSVQQIVEDLNALA